MGVLAKRRQVQDAALVGEDLRLTSNCASDLLGGAELHVICLGKNPIGESEKRRQLRGGTAITGEGYIFLHVHSVEQTTETQ